MSPNKFHTFLVWWIFMLLIHHLSMSSTRTIYLTIINRLLNIDPTFITLHNLLVVFRGTMFHISILLFFWFRVPCLCVLWTLQQTSMNYPCKLITISFFGKRPSCNCLLMLSPNMVFEPTKKQQQDWISKCGQRLYIQIYGCIQQPLLLSM